MQHVYIDSIEIKINGVTYGQDGCFIGDGQILLMNWIEYNRKLNIVEFQRY